MTVFSAAAGQSGLDQLLGSLAGNSTVILAVLGLIGGIIAAKVIKPPTYAELVTENRNLRADRDKADAAVSSLREEFETFKKERTKERAADRKLIGILGDGVEAMWSYIHVLREALSSAGREVPEPSDYLEATMESARIARTIDPASAPKE